MKKWGIAAVVAAACLFSACGQKWRAVDAIKKKGELVLYTDATWPPNEYIGEAGAVEGVDIDIGQAIAASLGVKLRVINASFDGFSLALQNGQADMAISAITITEERRESLDFSNPYMNTIQYIVKPASDTSINSFKDLAGRRVGAQLGTTGDILITDHIRDGVLKGTGAAALQFKALQEAMLGMLKGDPFAVVCDEALAKNLVAVYSGTVCVPVNTPDEQYVEPEYYGVAVAKGNTSLCDAINDTLFQLRASGKIDKQFVYHTERSRLYSADE